jgi:hypothetical protein
MSFGPLYPAVFLGALALVATGCIRTDINTDLNPAATVREYKQVVVWARSVDSGQQQRLEQELLALAVEDGLSTRFIPASEHFPPETDQGAGELSAKLAGLNADGLLFLFPTDSGAAVTGIPRTRSLKYDIPAHTSEAPWEHLSAMLFDAALGETVWLAEVELTGTSFQVHEDLRSRFIEEILAELETTGFVGR